ncbi:MAG: hypothetical protein DRO39_06645 [Thermoprotei archaeon]|nr:MAG: hypothetical protein DRO39_06645 [Thermoprotei archaeon]
MDPATTGDELRERLRRFLEDRIQRLREELELYEALLYMVDRAALEEEPLEEHRVKTPEGGDVAVIRIGRSGVRIVPLIELPASSPLVKGFLLRVIDEQLLRLNPRSPPRVRVRTRDGYLAEIAIEARLPSYVLEQLEAALKYVAMKLGGGGPSSV